MLHIQRLIILILIYTTDISVPRDQPYEHTLRKASRQHPLWGLILGVNTKYIC